MPYTYKFHFQLRHKAVQNNHSWSKHQESKPWVSTPRKTGDCKMFGDSVLHLKFYVLLLYMYLYVNNFSITVHRVTRVKSWCVYTYYLLMYNALLMTVTLAPWWWLQYTSETCRSLQTALCSKGKKIKGTLCRPLRLKVE